MRPAFESMDLLIAPGGDGVRILVKLFATLRDGRFVEETREYAPGTTVRQVVKELGITDREAALTFVDGRHVTLDREMADGETLAVFPPIGGG